jgi:hypothetical protein
MKKQLFSFVLVLALVILARTAFGQTSVAPYLGETYTYTVSGLDQVTADRTVKIYLTTDLAKGTKIDPTSAFTASGGGLTAYSSNTSEYTATLAKGATTTPASFSFNVKWNATLTAGTKYNLWIEIVGTSCNNRMYLDITPIANNIQYAVSSPTPVCPTPEVPNVQGKDAVADVTVVDYTVTRTNGNASDSWSFDFAVTPTSFGSQAVTLSTNTAGATISSGNVSVPVNTNSVLVQVTITNSPSTADTDFTGTISNTKQYVGSTTVVNNTSDKGGANSSISKLNYVPKIGGFSGN